MWNDRLENLQAERSRLVARSHALRERLAHETQPLQRPLAAAGSVRDGLRWLMSHPLWIAGAAALPLLLRPRRAAGWGVKLWWGWRLWRQLRTLLQRDTG